MLLDAACCPTSESPRSISAYLQVVAGTMYYFKVDTAHSPAFCPAMLMHWACIACLHRSTQDRSTFSSRSVGPNSCQKNPIFPRYERGGFAIVIKQVMVPLPCNLAFGQDPYMIQERTRLREPSQLAFASHTDAVPPSWLLVPLSAWCTRWQERGYPAGVFLSFYDPAIPGYEACQARILLVLSCDFRYSPLARSPVRHCGSSFRCASHVQPDATPIRPRQLAGSDVRPQYQPPERASVPSSRGRASRTSS
jgi:hypothetical protein